MSIEDAPKNSLPSYSDCSLRVANAEFLKENKLEDDDFYDGSLLPSAIHEFIYEYSATDEYKNNWWLHRLENLINFVRADERKKIQGDEDKA